MDWEKIDLTLEGHIGGEDHPNMPRRMRTRQRWDLYMDLFGTDRDGVLRLVRDESELLQFAGIERDAQEFDNAANAFMGLFGRFPRWACETHPWLRGAMSGGDCCDRCMVVMNLLNASGPGCCDNCEREMSEEMAANPDVVFAFEHGGLRAVA